MKHSEENRWKGFVLGALGGLVGIVTMRAYWKAATALAGSDPRSQQNPDDIPETDALDSISLVGQHHQPGESSTDALGRVLYEQIAGKPLKAEETQTALSYIVHWGMSTFASAVYGAMRGKAGVPDARGGMALAVGLWGLGDELIVPMLGLTSGPTAYPLQLHAHSLGAHVAYGLGSAAATQVLHTLL